jgi:hypothetical protein
VGAGQGGSVEGGAEGLAAVVGRSVGRSSPGCSTSISRCRVRVHILCRNLGGWGTFRLGLFLSTKKTK